MNAPALVRGRCPGLLAPMQAGDGWLVRIRPRLNQLSIEQALGLAEMAENYGQSALQLSNRANIQLRGIEEAALPKIAEQVAALDLGDRSQDAEAARNIVVSPLRTDGDGQSALANQLEDGLAKPEWPKMPGKFGYAIDAGKYRYLTNVSADIRIEKTGDNLLVRADGATQGTQANSIADAIQRVQELAGWFAQTGGIGADGRGRMARHLQRQPLPNRFCADRSTAPKAPQPAPGIFAGHRLFGAAFGQLTTSALRWLAGQTASPLRLTPWRMVALKCDAADSSLAHADLLVEPDDPRSGIEICAGAPACLQAQSATRALAERLVRSGKPIARPLHISGCPKGCAYPRPAPLTLVGRTGAFELVRNGAAWDEPSARNLDVETILCDETILTGP